MEVLRSVSNSIAINQKLYTGIASKTFVLTLNNPNSSKQVTTNLLKEGEGVKYMLLDKVVYDKRQVYALLKEALGF